MHRRLKNYTKYLSKLESYAEAMGIRIVRKDYPGDGCFDQLASIITLDHDLEESSELATLLHELGHAFDYSLYDTKKSSKIWNAYGKVYDEAHNDDHLNTVLLAERRAWENGRVIAKRLKIPLGKWFSYEQKTALTDYRKA